MKHLFILLLFSSCQFDSKPIILKPKSNTMIPQQKVLQLNCVYSFCKPNSLTEKGVLQKFDNASVVIKKFVGNEVKEERISLLDFWEMNPVHVGKL